MKSLANDKKFSVPTKLSVPTRLSVLFAATALALLVAASPATAGDDLTLYLGPGFNVVETSPLPHVSCRNRGAQPGTPAYARAYMDPGLTGYDRYRLWICHGGPESFASQLSVPPAIGDLIEFAVHAVSDGFDPVVLLETSSYLLIDVSCRNLTQGGPAVTATAPVGTHASLETWECNFGGQSPAAGDGILMIIRGTYL